MAQSMAGVQRLFGVQGAGGTAAAHAEPVKMTRRARAVLAAQTAKRDAANGATGPNGTVPANGAAPASGVTATGMSATAGTSAHAAAAPGTTAHAGGAARGTQPAAPVLDAVHIEKVYGSRNNVTRALADVSFTVMRGEFVGIMGASGSGKSTLLNCVSTIDAVTSGQVVINGEDVTRLKSAQLTRFRREQLGFIFQDSNLLDTLTARENIALPLTISRAPADQTLKRVEEVARRLDIAATLDKYPYQLSGGQQQRVAAARALVTNPAVIMADEPTGALDSKNARLLLESLETMNRQLKATVLMVTHDSFAASYTNRVLFIRDGRIFTELRRGDAPRQDFFNRIMEVVAMMGGEGSDAL